MFPHVDKSKLSDNQLGYDSKLKRSSYTADSFKDCSLSDLNTRRSETLKLISDTRSDRDKAKTDAQKDVDDAKEAYDTALEKDKSVSDETKNEKSRIDGEISTQEGVISQINESISAQQDTISSIDGNEPQQSAYTKTEEVTDADGNKTTKEVPDEAAYNAAHAEWEAQKAEAEELLSSLEQELGEAEDALSTLQQEATEIDNKIAKETDSEEVKNALTDYQTA